MKIIDNIIYLRVDIEDYKKRMRGNKTDIMRIVNKTEDALIQSSEINFISITNIDTEWSFMKKIKNIFRLDFKDGIIIYIFCW